MTVFQLRLYISGPTAQSQRAIRNLRDICETELAGACDVEVIDVLEHPQRAERARILATPTLVKQLPGPPCKLIGDLSDRARVLLGLTVEPTGKGA